jgi:chemotaxis protein CheD
MFADSGMDQLLGQVASLGANKKRLKVKIAGGAQMLNDGGLFNIGRRNHASIRKVLWQHGLFLDGEDVGGTAPRTLHMQVADGTVTCKMQGQSKAL